MYVDTVINFAKYHIHILRTTYIHTTYYIQNEWSHSLFLNTVQARQKALVPRDGVPLLLLAPPRVRGCNFYFLPWCHNCHWKHCNKYTVLEQGPQIHHPLPYHAPLLMFKQQCLNYSWFFVYYNLQQSFVTMATTIDYWSWLMLIWTYTSSPPDTTMTSPLPSSSSMFKYN